MERKLSVKKERLVELTTDDLVRVAGAAADQYTLALVRTCDNGGTLHGCTTAINCPRPMDA